MIDATNDALTQSPQDVSRYLIRPSRLEGVVRISGAKNSVLKLLTASLLTREELRIHNYPAGLLDAQVHVEMLELLGKECVIGDSVITIREPSSIASVLAWEGRSIRNTLLMLGALTTRTGEGRVPLPGGCQLGDRKIDLHEKVLRALGARVWVEDGMLCAESPTRLRGTDIHLPIRSTGATENAIISATLAEGVTNVWNPHIRPEILDLVRFLNNMGARITVHGQERIEIDGVEELSGAKHTVIPDNMEALSWLIGAVVTGGDVEILDFPYHDLEVPLIHLRESGAKFYRHEESLIVRGGRCYPVEISTGPYPGINSDMQPLFAVYGACANGESRIVDLRFPDRYGYVDELAKMGVQASVSGNMLILTGGNALHGAQVKAVDLRAGIALVLAGLTASGETEIGDAWQITRGYDQFIQKLVCLGGDIHCA